MKAAPRPKRAARSSPSSRDNRRRQRRTDKSTINGIEVTAVPARKREKAAEATVVTGGKGSPVRRKTKVMSTRAGLRSRRGDVGHALRQGGDGRGDGD